MVVTCCRYGPGPAGVGAGAAGYGQAAGAPAGMAPIQQQQQQAGYGGMQEQPMQTGQGYEMLLFTPLAKRGGLYRKYVIFSTLTLLLSL